MLFFLFSYYYRQCFYDYLHEYTFPYSYLQKQIECFLGILSLAFQDSKLLSQSLFIGFVPTSCGMIVYNSFKFFNWRKIALQCLQCCVGFCRITMKISHNCTHTHTPPFPLEPPSLLSHATVQVTRVPGWAFCVIQQLPTSCLFYT